MTTAGPGWTPAALAILDRACEQHGGWARWQSLRRISMTPAEIRGLLQRVKGIGVTFPLPPRIDVYPHDVITVFQSYPDQQHRGIFEKGHVKIESVSTGTITQSSSNQRATFTGFAKNRRWSPLDGLYFFGYALWHYHALPFTLRGARLLRADRVNMEQRTLDALHVEFRPEVPTHSARQTFYFDETGRLHRHDYVAEVIGAWACGAHYWMDYKKVNGLLIASRRFVQPRLGMRTFPLTILEATFTDIAVDPPV